MPTIYNAQTKQLEEISNELYEGIVETAIPKEIKREVVKAGSDIIDNDFVAFIARKLAYTVKSGTQVFYVTSGFIKYGKEKHLLDPKSGDEMTRNQMYSMLGGRDLMNDYATEFGECNQQIAGPILVTRKDFVSENEEYLMRTLVGLAYNGFIPVINQNDAVSVDEIKFGDNDNLSARVACLVKADMLEMLTKNALYSSDPRNGDAKKIDIVTRVDDNILRMSSEEATGYGKGGMKTKVMAAKRVTDRGITAVVSGIKKIEDGLKVFEETIFLPKDYVMPKTLRHLF